MQGNDHPLPAPKSSKMLRHGWVSLCLPDAIQGDDWNLAAGLLLILGKLRQACYHLGVQALTLLPLSNHCSRLKTLAAYLNGSGRVGNQIVVPVRVSRRSRFRSDDDKVVAIGGICQGRGTGLTTLRSNS